jgi:peptide/nickel transport system permease protein
MAKENKAIEPNKNEEVLQEKEQLALDDARRVKVLSPGMLVFKRFIRNKLAVIGIIILVFMFIFSFLGPLFSPYGISQVFFKEVDEPGDYATGKYVEGSLFYPSNNTALNSAVLKTLGENKVAGKYSLIAGEEIPFAAGSNHYTLKVINPDPDKPSCAVYGTTHIATASKGEVKWYDESFVDEALLVAITENAAQDKPGTELAWDGMTISIESDRFETKYYAPSSEPVAVTSYSSYSPLLGRVGELQADTAFLHDIASAVKAGETSVTREGETYNLTGDTISGFVLSSSDGTPLMNVVREFISKSVKLEEQDKDGNPVTKDKDFLSLVSDSKAFVEAAKQAVAENAKEVVFEDTSYEITENGNEYLILNTDGQIGMTVVTSFDPVESKYDSLSSDFNFINAMETAIASGASTFEYDGETYSYADDNGSYSAKNSAGEDVVLASNIVYGPAKNGIELTADFANKLREAIVGKQNKFTFVDQYGEETEAQIELKVGNYYVKTMQKTSLFDQRAPITAKHLLGTENNGMDVLTRLMYGGRVSLIVGFVVIFFRLIIGVIIGGISGYFGGIVDTILMRFVELFSAIPFYPMLIIIGSVMDNLRVGPIQRLFMTMVLLGVLGWTGIARIVRGQILSLREQDFMVATEATGIRTSRRIFKHLVPNVMPQLIVNATSALGEIILTEATLGFLGLGVKYPMASWGSIINQVNDMQVMQTAWWIWIPAGLLILLTVLGFNFVGDGLRDAFDPKMKR